MNSNFIISQTSEDCVQTLSIFAEFAKVKNYDSAFEPWMKVRKNCSKINPAIYSYGERILKDKIKKTSGEEKNSCVCSPSVFIILDCPLQL